MTMASGLYVVTFSSLLKNTLAKDVASASNIVCLYTDTKTPDFEDDTAHSATNEIASGNGYTQNTKTVGGTPTLASAGATSQQMKYTWSAPVEWTSSTITNARGMIIGCDTSLEPIVAVTFGSDYSSNNGTFSITAHANGIFYVDMVP